MGTAIIILGVILALGNIFDVNIGALCWPAAFILLGLWLLFKPQLGYSTAGVKFTPLGNVHRRGEWQVDNEDFLIFVGGVNLDMSQAEIPLGETNIRVGGFVGDVKILVLYDVGVSVTSLAFVSDTRILSRKRDSIFIAVDVTSDDYGTSERKIRLETYFFVGGIKVNRAERAAEGS